MGKINKSKASPKKSKDSGSESDASNSSSGSDAPAPVTKFSEELKSVFDGETNLYAILGVEKSATCGEIKKAYHKLSLKVHPDKVDEDSREKSTRKFQALGNILNVLKDADKRAIYDSSGEVDGDDFVFESDGRDWEAFCKVMFKKVTEEDVKDFFKDYKNSGAEKDDLLRFYKKHNGDLDKIMEDMWCESVLDDEKRFKEILKEAIEKEEVDDLRLFSAETKAKAAKRRQKYEKEADEADEMKKEMGLGDGEDALKKMISEREGNRKKQADALFKHLEQKYAGKKRGKKAKDEPEEDDDEEEKMVDDGSDEDYGSKKKKTPTKKVVTKKAPAKKTPAKKRKASDDDDDEEDEDEDEDEDEVKQKEKPTRGTPKKTYKEDDEAEEGVKQKEKPKRGTPKKTYTEDDEDEEMEMEKKKPRGRPKGAAVAKKVAKKPAVSDDDDDLDEDVSEGGSDVSEASGDDGSDEDYGKKKKKAAPAKTKGRLTKPPAKPKKVKRL